MLTVAVPLSKGTVARYDGPDLEQLDYSVASRFARLEIGVEPEAAGPDVDPDDVRARVALHELRVGGG